MVSALNNATTGTPTRVELGTVVETSMRLIRDVRDYHVPRPRFVAPIHPVAASSPTRELLAERDSIDHLTHYQLRIQPVHGTTAKETLTPDHRAIYTLEAPPGQTVDFELETTSNEKPLTPVPIEEIVTPEILHHANPHDLAEFAYLVYRECILAGADNYLTFFGRDNEFLLTLGATGLQPRAFEIVFASHLAAMAPDGNLAHEPSIGEFASLEREQAGHGAERIPSYNYNMIDTRFLLAPSVAIYLSQATPERAREFFSQKGPQGVIYQELLIRNLAFVEQSARAFARTPRYANLIHLKAGFPNGQWRDSADGLGRGRYPYDVNVALVPAALKAITTISSHLDSSELRNLASQATHDLRVWSKRTPPLFRVSVPRREAIKDIRSYGQSLQLGPGMIQTAIQQSAPQGEHFPAISLDASGHPVALQNSDGGFLLRYRDDITDNQVLDVIQAATEPFPAGLYSPIGLFISNAAYAGPRIRGHWDFNYPYHGVVVWPWQEFLMAQGIAHQLGRADLRPRTVEALKKAELKLWGALYQTASYLSIELYSARPQGDTLVPAAYGDSAQDETTSAIIQGWSKLGLLIQPPARVIQALGPMPGGTAAGRRFGKAGP